MPRSSNRSSKLQENLQAPKRENPALQNMKFLHFYLFLGSFLPSWIRIQPTKNSMRTTRIRIHNTGLKVRYLFFRRFSRSTKRANPCAAFARRSSASRPSCACTSTSTTSSARFAVTLARWAFARRATCRSTSALWATSTRWTSTPPLARRRRIIRGPSSAATAWSLSGKIRGPVGKFFFSLETEVFLFLVKLRISEREID